MKHTHAAPFNVSRETLKAHYELCAGYTERLSLYAELLLEWNRSVNLISRGLHKKDVMLHAEHSLSIMLSDLFKSSDIVADAGSGGGLPGIPLAIVNPQKQFILIDLVEKKCLAMKDMVRRLSLVNVEVVACDIEVLHIAEPFLYVSKHAFKLNEFIKKTNQQNWTGAVFLKGADFMGEIDSRFHFGGMRYCELDAVYESSFYKGKRMLELLNTGRHEQR